MKNNPPNNDKQSLFPQTHKDINNDTFQILLQAVLCIYLTIISLYDYITTINLPRINKRLIVILVILFLLSFVYSFQSNENIEITEQILMSAYYPNMKTNRISYDEIASSNHSYIGFHFTDTVDVISNYYNEYYEGNEFPLLKDIKNLNVDAHVKLARNLYKIYGNKTVFKLELEDLEKMVNSSIISERQALFFWDVLLQDKVDKATIHNMKYLNEKNYDMYFFKFIPLKGCFFAFVSFMIIYFFLLKTYALPIKNSFIFNIFGISIIFIIVHFFYRQKFYLASGLLFIQLIYFVKCLLDSMALWLGYPREDFEIFSSNLSAKNMSQFVLKFFILFILTIVTGFLSIGIFNYFFNYIIFYLTLFTLFVFISNCFEHKAPPILSPLKNLLFFSLGLMNFIISKFHKSITHLNLFSYCFPALPDSLYLISDLFTIFCFHYLHGFFQSQIKFLIEKQNNNSYKAFNPVDDSLWLLGFLIGIFICVVGIFKQEYMCLAVSMYLIKIVMEYFSKIFTVKFVRCIFDMMVMLFVIANSAITNKRDEYLTALFIGPQSTSNILYYVFKLIGLFQIFFFIMLNFDYVYSGFNEKNSELEEISKEAAEALLRKVEIVTRIDKKKNKKFKTLQIQVIRPEKQFSLKAISYVNFDFIWNYFNICVVFYIMLYYEKNYLCLIIYILILFIFFVRNFFIILEFKHDNEYLYSYLVSLIISLRLLVITKNISVILYLLCHINVISLVLLYCLIDRRKNLVTLFVLIHLYAGCLVLNSNFLFIDFVTVLCVPLSFGFMHNNSYEVDDKGNGCSLAFLFPALIVLLCQLYGFKNVYQWMVLLHRCSRRVLFGFDFVNVFVTLRDGEFNEFSLMRYLMNLLKH